MKRLYLMHVEEGALYRFTSPPSVAMYALPWYHNLNEIWLTQEVASFDKGLVTLLTTKKIKYLRKNKTFQPGQPQSNHA